jgi:hypothetical protein
MTARMREGVSFRQSGGGVTCETLLSFENKRRVWGVSKVGGGLNWNPRQALGSGRVAVVKCLK